MRVRMSLCLVAIALGLSIFVDAAETRGPNRAEAEAMVGLPSEARENGLGSTAPPNLHHWVGYAAVGYRLPK